MQKINRRSFLGKTSTGLGSAFALSQLSLPMFLKSIPELYDMAVGFQTFPIRDKVAKDFPGTMKMMSGQGFQLVEMCSPKGLRSHRVRTAGGYETFRNEKNN